MPGAGIVKGAAASPLNTFAGRKGAYENNALANGTLHHPHISQESKAQRPHITPPGNKETAPLATILPDRLHITKLVQTEV
ncbi:hypothetical protein GCM10011513_12880 [Franconibacter daqui]|nr:hypothetical protein GCM10011513_12880 [Franconibacter daqui]